ncbi:receptor-type tyrosine-protein phosphatase C-like [Fundulus diaphanus]
MNFIDPNDIKQTGPTKLPANIEATFPLSCKNLSVEYKCSGKDNTSVEPSDMKPFTDYSCTGLIKNNNVFINKTTPPVHFNIDCDFTIKDLEYRSTDTSIHLSWETTSDKCQDILRNLEKLSFRCSCQDAERTEVQKSKEPVGGTCDIRGLKAYTDYRCEVRPIYPGQRYFTGQYVKIKTKPGIPAKPTGVKEAEPSENNAIRVKCEGPKEFKGPEKIYIAKLLNGPGPEKSNTKCDFEFKDLSYSTTYTVEIVTFNGHLRSESVRMQAASRYNFKARFGVLSFLLLLIIIITAITEIVAFIIRRRASRRNKPGYQHRDKETH